MGDLRPRDVRIRKRAERTGSGRGHIGYVEQRTCLQEEQLLGVTAGKPQGEGQAEPWLTSQLLFPGSVLSLTSLTFVSSIKFD